MRATVVTLLSLYILGMVMNLSGSGEITPQQLVKNINGKNYTGQKMTFTFYNTKIVDAIKGILGKFRMPVWINGKIEGELNLELVDIQWDKALAMILEVNKLRILWESNVLKVESRNIKRKASHNLTFLTKTKSKFTGEPGNFIFFNADLENVLIYFARQYHLNIILDPGIHGKVTCRLINVPWDQALDVILKQHRLAMIKQGNIINLNKY
jgi:type II secretory pathway component HofQ